MMKREKVQIRENNIFFRTPCAICGHNERPSSLMFVNEEGEFVCDRHVHNNEVELTLSQDDIVRLDTLVYWGIIKEWEEKEREEQERKDKEKYIKQSNDYYQNVPPTDELPF